MRRFSNAWYIVFVCTKSCIFDNIDLRDHDCNMYTQWKNSNKLSAALLVFSRSMKIAVQFVYVGLSKLTAIGVDVSISQWCVFLVNLNWMSCLSFMHLYIQVVVVVISNLCMSYINYIQGLRPIYDDNDA